MAKKKNIKDMSIEELNAKLVECRESLFNFRFQKSEFRFWKSEIQISEI